MPTRRKFLTTTALASGAVLTPRLTNATGSLNSTQDKLKIMVFGAHPDDPETGMGGTICKYTSLGHEVVVVYFTAGEAGIDGISHADAANIRKKEAEKACRIMKTRAIFFGQVDGSCVITPEWYDNMPKLLKKEGPDILFTHWPIDSHRDHRICSNLVYDAWLYAGKKEPLYFYEVCAGNQSQNFQPDTFVDISSVIQQKWEACFVHESQKIKEIYSEEHAKMELFRGLEGNAKYAEAFIHHWQSPRGLMP